MTVQIKLQHAFRYKFPQATRRVSSRTLGLNSCIFITRSYERDKMQGAIHSNNDMREISLNKTKRREENVLHPPHHTD